MTEPQSQGTALALGAAVTADSPVWPSVRLIQGRLRVFLRMPSMPLLQAMDLRVGQVLTSDHPEMTDIPLCVGGVKICWCEFAAVDDRMAVRITQLA